VDGKPVTLSGHAITTIEQALSAKLSIHRRVASIRELALARALYRCGDHKGLALKILTVYSKDLRGHFARNAQAALKRPAEARRADPAP
jgi:hypothetical protein